MELRLSRRSVPSLTLLLFVLLVSTSLVAIACGGSPASKAVGVNLTPTPLPASIGGCQIARDTECPGADLSGADLGSQWAGRDQIRAGADLRDANFEGANFSNAKLGEVNLQKANLKNANLTNAYLVSAFLFGADLSGADLTGADLSNADVDEVKTVGAVFCNTKWADLAVKNDDCP